MAYGIIGYVVPHTRYPAGYHSDPSQPLPFMALASRKGYVALYHMGLDDSPLLDWLRGEWKKASTTKLDVGKSCVRMKPDAIPYDLIGELATKLTVPEWIARYEKGVTSQGTRPRASSRTSS